MSDTARCIGCLRFTRRGPRCLSCANRFLRCSVTAVPVWMGLGNPPRELTRRRWRALAATWAGEAWDEWAAQGGPRQLRSETEIRTELAETAARVLARYHSSPEWTPADAAASLTDILSGRDPRRTQAAIIALRGAP